MAQDQDKTESGPTAAGKSFLRNMWSNVWQSEAQRTAEARDFSFDSKAKNLSPIFVHKALNVRKAFDVQAPSALNDFGWAGFTDHKLTKFIDEPRDYSLPAKMLLGLVHLSWFAVFLINMALLVMYFVLLYGNSCHQDVRTGVWWLASIGLVYAIAVAAHHWYVRWRLYEGSIISGDDGSVWRPDRPYGATNTLSEVFVPIAIVLLMASVVAGNWRFHARWSGDDWLGDDVGGALRPNIHAWGPCNVRTVVELNDDSRYTVVEGGLSIEQQQLQCCSHAPADFHNTALMGIVLTFLVTALEVYMAQWSRKNSRYSMFMLFKHAGTMKAIDRRTGIHIPVIAPVDTHTQSQPDSKSGKAK